MADSYTLTAQLMAATSGQDNFVAILMAVNSESLPPERWAEEIRFETYLAASGLPRNVVALDALKSSPASDADLDTYNARVTRTCPLSWFPGI